jgi:uncharacterized small protein (DUF1192 family)
MPIDTDELEPPKKKIELLNLEAMSIDELEAYIAQLTREIDRVKEKITAKKAHRDAASAVFGKRTS